MANSQKHPACRKEGRKSISTWVCPSQKYYLTSAPDRDVLMAVRNVPVFDKLVRFSAHSGHGISTSSQGDQGILARQTHLATLVLCSWDANLTAEIRFYCIVLFLCSFCALFVFFLCSFCALFVLFLCSFCALFVLLLCSFCALFVLFCIQIQVREDAILVHVSKSESAETTKWSFCKQG